MQSFNLVPLTVAVAFVALVVALASAKGCTSDGSLKLGSGEYTQEQVAAFIVDHQIEARMSARSIASLALSVTEDADERRETAETLYGAARVVLDEVEDRTLDAGSIVSFTDEIVGQFEFRRKALVMNVYRTAVDVAEIIFQRQFAQLEEDVRNEAASALLRGVARGVLEAAEPYVDTQ